jgi:hypothetical protein
MMVSLPVNVLAAGLLVFLVGCASLTTRPETGEWKFIGKSRTGTSWYIDRETASGLSGGIITLWVKSIPEKVSGEKGGDEESTETVLKKIQGKYFGDYEYTEGLWELDCARNMFRLLYFCAYGKDNIVITSHPTPDAEWSHIIQGSVGETIQEAVCRK